MKTKIILLIFSFCLLFSCSDKDDDLKKGSDWTVKLSISNFQEDCSLIVFAALADNIVLTEKTTQIPAEAQKLTLPNYEFSGKGKQLIIITSGGNSGTTEIPLNYVIEIFENNVLRDTKTFSVLDLKTFSETYIIDSQD